MSDKDKYLTEDKFEKRIAGIEQLLRELLANDEEKLVKAYPQIKMPDSGALAPRNSMLPITVKSNKMMYQHLIRFFKESPLTGIGAAIPVDFTNIAQTIPTPAIADEYLLICYVEGDDPLNPGAATHHIERIGMTITI